MNPLILLVVGLILVFIEFYIPGAIMGIFGGFFILISIVLFAIKNNSGLLVSLYTIAIIASLILLVRFALWKIKNTKPESSIYSDDDQVGFVASEFDKSAIGKVGIVLTDLKPGGYILVDGIQHQAISIDGYLVKGCEVTIIGGQEESLIVKQVKNLTFKDNPL